MENFWIIGCGDIGRRVALKLNDSTQNKPFKTTALVVSDNSVKRCKSLNINTLQYDLDSAEPLYTAEFLNGKVFYFAPPQKDGETDNRLAHFLTEVGGAPKRIVLISTTGVYGNCNGNWVNENTPLNPQTGRAKRRVSAEHLLQDWAKKHDREYIILRVPGIYALDRLPLARLEKRLPIVRASEAAFTNRIHADDLAEICIQAMQSSLTAEIFNATDGTPGTMVEYFNQVADYAHLPRPEQISLKEAEEMLSQGMLSYALESRRIGNEKLLKLLNVKLKYPTLTDTLKAT